MKKLICTLSCIVALSGCSFKSASSGNNSTAKMSKYSTIAVNDIAVVSKTAYEDLNMLTNFDVADGFSVQIPQNINKVSDFVLSYSSRQSNREFYNSFKDMFSYLFPNHKLNSEYFLYYGNNSYPEFDDNGIHKSVM